MYRERERETRLQRGPGRDQRNRISHIRQRCARSNSNMTGITMRSFTHAIGLLTSLLLITVPRQAVCENHFLHGKHVDAAVTSEIERQQIVGASIGIIQDSTVVYTQGYGWSDLKRKIPVPHAGKIRHNGSTSPVIYKIKVPHAGKNER